MHHLPELTGVIFHIFPPGNLLDHTLGKLPCIRERERVVRRLLSGKVDR
jgi:hypothetical protein